MHALAGIICPTANPAWPRAVDCMIDRLSRGTSLRSGRRSVPRVGLHLGWTTAQADPSREAPAWSVTGQVALILAGDALSDRSGTTPSANALADAYEQSGLAALLALNGAFSGLIVDLRDETVTLFNDRFGLERIYYHTSDGAFYFSSQAKSLLALLPSLRRLDPRGLAEWFSVGCVLQNRSLFSGISILPPASAWRFRADGRIEKHRYFDPATWEKQEPLSATEYNDQLCSVFSRLGARYLRSSSETAISLTGGLDSRAVLAWSRAGSSPLPCYTFGGPYRDCADVRIARQLAELCRLPHVTIRVGETFFSRFATLAEQSVYVSDGAMDVSGSVELHVNHRARMIAPVRLTGNYGSEILRSHVAFRPGRLDRSLFTPEFDGLIDEAAQTYRAEAAGHRLSFIAFKQVPWHHHARFSVEKTQVTPRSPFLDQELVALAYRAPAELQSSTQPLLNLIARGNPSLAGVATDRALRTHNVPIASKLARTWQEFTAKAEYAYDYGMPAWLARADRALTRLRLEKLFLGRHKFYHFRVWYRDRLREAVHSQTSAVGQDNGPFCYRTGAARRVVDEHLSGRANRTTELHKLLSLQLIDRLLLRAS